MSMIIYRLTQNMRKRFHLDNVTWTMRFEFLRYIIFKKQTL